MLLRRILPVALAAVALAGCEPSIPKGTTGRTIDYVVFDPSTSQIPLPNDLAWQQAPTGAPRNAQDELLQMFAAQQGFPNDQEVPITIDVQQWTIGGSAPQKGPPPSAVDPATLTAATLLVLDKDLATGATVPVTALDKEFVTGSDRGTLMLHNPVDPASGSRRWKANHQYVVVLRGGADGAQLVGGGQLTAMPTMYLITQGVTNGQELPGASLALPQNQDLLPGNTRAERAVAGAQLELLRQGYLPVFGAVDQAWGAGATQQIVSLQVFTIAPQKGTQVVTDASAGAMPLPSDFLLDPATGGKTVVNNPAFGPLAAGIATLDGFSTTAMILSQTSGPIAVETVNKDSVFLYDLTDPAHPARVPEAMEGPGAGFVAEPLVLGKTLSDAACTTAAGCFSTAIGLQPATLLSASPVASLPPLKEGTEYAVIVTNGVAAVDTTATPPLAPLQPSTLARILLFQNPLVDASGKSQLPGESDATAAGLELMRQGVAAAAAALAAEKPTLTSDKIALAYTFRTQTITQTALELAAAPYQNAAAFVPGVPSVVPAAAIPVPLPAVQEVLSVPVPTLDPIDVQTGAMDPNTGNWKPASLNAFVAVPQAAAVTTSCPAPASALKCAPLVVFQHGLGETKSDVFAIANALAASGAVVAAIDAPLHGDRAYCTQDADCACPAGATGCTPKCGFFGPAGLQGDAMQIGLCVAPSAAVPSVSGKFFVTGNFFRTRDAIREDILDTSALVLALAPPAVPSNPLAAELASKGIAVDPMKVYWVGQSLGGIYGVLNTAANPRVGRAVLDVPGATLVDIFANSPSFAPAVDALLASLTPPIAPGTPQYLQFLQVAKWVLDPGDPINFARHLIGDAAHPTLPDLLAQQPNQAPKNVFGQYAICDQTIPNPYNLFLFDQIGLGATPSSGPNGYTAYVVAGAGTPDACAAPNVNPAHGFLLNGIDPAATGAGQADAAAYLLDLALPPTATRP